MVWFKVDDKLHSHPKAVAASLAALGLWTVAGSWAGDHTTDGDVPESMVWLLSRGATELADELVKCGLWRRTKSGYRFHEWEADGDGSARNPSSKAVAEGRRKKAEAGRKGGLASGKARSKGQARASPDASGMVELPTRPLPSPKGEGSLGDERHAAHGAASAAPNGNGGKPPPEAAALLDQLRADLAKPKRRNRTAPTEARHDNDQPEYSEAGDGSGDRPSTAAT